MSARQSWAALALALAGVLAAFGLGRWSAPVLPARVEVKVVEVEAKKAAEHRVEAPSRTTTTTRPVACPGVVGSLALAAPVFETTTVEERGAVVIDRTEEEQRTKLASALTVAPPSLPRWMVGASYGLRLGSPPSVGALVAYRLAGPVWLGASATLAGDLRASVAASW